MGTGQVSRASVCMCKSRFVQFFLFTYIRPEVYVSASGFKFAPRLIMIPAPARSIFRRIMPALVSGHDQAFVTFEPGCFTVFTLRVGSAYKKQQSKEEQMFEFYIMCVVVYKPCIKKENLYCEFEV